MKAKLEKTKAEVAGWKKAYDELIQQRFRNRSERQLLPREMWDKTDTLEYTPPKALVRVTLYPKYACLGAPECGIASPERPTSLVEGNRYGTSVAAQVITGKYGYGEGGSDLGFDPRGAS